MAISTRCRLLELPAELKNRIYRETMVKSTRIIVTSAGYERSGLLQTCKEIRDETFRIFYAENLFRNIVVNYDSSTRLRWYDTIKKARTQGLLKECDLVHSRESRRLV